MTPGRGFVPFDERIHDSKNFDCGMRGLNHFLRDYAHPHRERKVSQTMVLPATEAEESSGLFPITAYYTTTVKEASRNKLTQAVAKRLPQHPLPIFYIACVAVDATLKRRGLGKRALISALKQFHEAMKQGSSGVGVFIEPSNEHVSRDYQAFGFEPLDDAQSTLFMSINQVDKLLADE